MHSHGIGLPYFVSIAECCLRLLLLARHVLFACARDRSSSRVIAHRCAQQRLTQQQHCAKGRREPPSSAGKDRCRQASPALFLARLPEAWGADGRMNLVGSRLFAYLQGGRSTDTHRSARVTGSEGKNISQFPRAVQGMAVQGVVQNAVFTQQAQHAADSKLPHSRCLVTIIHLHLSVDVSGLRPKLRLPGRAPLVCQPRPSNLLQDFDVFKHLCCPAPAAS